MKNLVLVLDSDATNTSIIKTTLEQYNIDVISAADGKKGLDYVKTFTPSLVISEISLPKINGFQLCEFMRKEQELSNIPLLIHTTLTGDQYRMRAIDSGANDFLEKPCSKIKLYTKVKSLLRLSNEFSTFEDFDGVLVGLLYALGKRNSTVISNSKRIAILAEQIAILANLENPEIAMLKKGIYLQDIAQLSMKEDIDFTIYDSAVPHQEIGYQMLKNTRQTVVKSIVRFHHANLKSKNYPNDLTDYVKRFINIANICNYYAYIKNYTQDVTETAALKKLEDETKNGLWDKEIYKLLYEVLKSNEASFY